MSAQGSGDEDGEVEGWWNSDLAHLTSTGSFHDYFHSFLELILFFPTTQMENRRYWAGEKVKRRGWESHRYRATDWTTGGAGHIREDGLVQHLHFIDEETEGQRGQSTCPRLYRKSVSTNSSPSTLSLLLNFLF